MKLWQFAKSFCPPKFSAIQYLCFMYDVKHIHAVSIYSMCMYGGQYLLCCDFVYQSWYRWRLNKLTLMSSSRYSCTVCYCDSVRVCRLKQYSCLYVQYETDVMGSHVLWYIIQVSPHLLCVYNYGVHAILNVFLTRMIKNKIFKQGIGIAEKSQETRRNHWGGNVNYKSLF